ncbi:LolA family protein [Syntrophomonas palmitatica]|uniref:LolA family protein n=1 Tax=Syntrophomonas palmitatica TaxID=402877 RepID=UPI0006D1E894|nr:DUF4412 domain-containing protein [Syntrophomonas palmitatica]
MKKLAFVIVMVLLTSSLVLAGCGKPSEKQPASNQVEEKKAPAKTTALTIGDLMQSAKAVKGLSYDSTSTLSSSKEVIKNKVFISGKKARFEAEVQGKKTVTISDGSNVYMYFPAENMAMKVAITENKNKPATEWAEGQAEDNLKIVGHEKIDGAECAVVEAVQGQETVRMWIREDIGIPARIESNTADGKILVENKNIKVGAQDENLFKLPAGVNVQSMNNMPQMPNLPDIKNMPPMPQMP